MFYGQYHHQLDDKGRVRIPPKFREQLGEKPMMLYGVEGCLLLYKAEDFAEMMEKRFADADMLDIRSSDIMRAILSLTQEVEIDKQGRAPINSTLMEKCGITKNVITIGMKNRIEIWDEKRFEEHMASIDLIAILSPFSEH